MAQVEIADKDMRRCMESYDRILAKQKWLAGDEMTLVDLCHPILIKMCQMVGFIRSPSHTVETILRPDVNFVAVAQSRRLADAMISTAGWINGVC